MTDEKFQALVVTEVEPKKFVRTIETRSTADLPSGDLLIRVHYSSLNYKDALSASGNRGVTREYPHTPGIDAAGVVAASANDEFVMIHMDADYSKNVAKLPDANIMGNLKLVYIVNALNAWMGDDGWIRKIGAEYRRQDLVNTTLTATGAVRAKRQEQGENLVDLDVWVENEQGEKTTPGHATVVLPGRS